MRQATVIARRRVSADVAIQKKKTGLLRCARNDAAGAVVIVITGLDPVIHNPFCWIPGSRPEMTKRRRSQMTQVRA